MSCLGSTGRGRAASSRLFGNRDPWLELTPEQIAEVDARIDAPGDYAAPEEVEAFFAKFKT
jgi:hypothetical protein